MGPRSIMYFILIVLGAFNAYKFGETHESFNAFLAAFCTVYAIVRISIVMEEKK